MTTATQFGAKNAIVYQSVASTMAVKKGRKGPSPPKANKLDDSDTGMFQHFNLSTFNRDVMYLCALENYLPPSENHRFAFLESGDECGGEEQPDVEDIESDDICKDNKATCINDNIDGVLEVFDEATCRDLLIGYYEVASQIESQLPHTMLKRLK